MAKEEDNNFANAMYDLDNAAEFNTCNQLLRQPDTSNFAVSFDGNSARCTANIDQNDVLKWLQGEHHNETHTRWLNFWASPSQRPIIEAVAKHYNLSPRLTGLLCPASSHEDLQKKRPPSDESLDADTLEADKPTSVRSSDVEKEAANARPPQTSATKNVTGLEGVTFGKVVESLWHFSSVDYGRRYTYVGFNALYLDPQSHRQNVQQADKIDASGIASLGQPTSDTNSKPAGRRIWSSLLICDDGTIISVYERPRTLDMSTHLTTRLNVLNVFRHLSRLHGQDESSTGSLMNVRVRWSESTNDPVATFDRQEAASLLFYYLFDDWVSTFRLIAQIEHPYREKLEDLRQRMLVAAKVSLVQQVHDVGRQLTVLKLMYQSYELIISRLLQRQRVMGSFRHTSASPLNEALEHDLGSSRNIQDCHASQYGQPLHDNVSGSNVKLSSSAIVRFERLYDRIRLYALTEIEECIKEKESLVLMNFNLVALKESQAVEKLTRTTILLAKATILFLPVSLMTAYFSIQVRGIEDKYSLETYWLSFLVVAVLSALFLLMFGGITHTLEGKTVYQSITRTFGRGIWNAARTMKRKKP